MKNKSFVRIRKREIVFLAIALIGLYVIVPQIGSFQDSMRIVSDAQLGNVALAVLAVWLTYASATVTYMLLAFKKLKFGTTFVVQFATMFINRLLPGGIGALGANYAYLRNRKHTSSQAVTVVAINNLLGFIGHALVFVVLIVFFNDSIPPIKTVSLNKNALYVLLFAGIVIIALGFLNKKIQRKLRKGFQSISQQIISYKTRVPQLAGALLSSITLTLFNVLSLYFCLSAIGGRLSFVTVFIVFSLGVGLGTATPTPGGLGGFEAGLVAGFVAVGIDAQDALAAALLYRFISYWMAIATGFIAFIYAQSKHYFSQEY